MPRPSIVQLQVLNRNNLLRNNMNNNDVRYPLIHMRDHLFHAAFVRLALIYSRVFSVRERKIIEFVLLSLSFLSLVILIYIHMAFVQTPSNCLAHVQDKWPRDGILRVEILKEQLNGRYSLEKSYLKERKIRELTYEDIASYLFFSYSMYDDSDDDYRWLMDTVEKTNKMKEESRVYGEDMNDTVLALNDTSSFNVTIDEKLKSGEDKDSLPTLTWSEDEYIMEFSLEYGFLKLSPSVRKQYNITVQLVTLDPNVDACFGGPLNNFILYNFLGYDEVLLASLKLLASKEEYKGYVRNVVTDVEFIFVNAWMDKKSYITAGFVMMVFTVSISILLRYSHHQIFVFIVELLHMLEFHSSFNFPAGPLLTVILALVGMEAIMSEFFNDTAIAFYVILIVWMADQFDTICCKSYFTKKHWLRFFYLYHFFFYAYSYRFGHNRFLALLTSWLFTVHSMVYFFHRYELPILISRRRRTQNPSPPDINPGNDLPGPDSGSSSESQSSSSTSTPDIPPQSDNSPQSDSLPQSETSTSVSSVIGSVSISQSSGNSTSGGSSNEQLDNDNQPNLVVEPRWRQALISSCERSSWESTKCKDFFNSELNPNAKDNRLRSTSKLKIKSAESACNANTFEFVVNLLTCLLLYSSIALLVRNVNVSPILYTSIRDFKSRVVLSKFFPRLRLLHL